MAVKYKDGDGNVRYRKNNGEAGSSGDPDTFPGTISSIAGGASADIGAVNDAAVTGDNAGSLSAKLRGLLKRWSLDIPAGVGQKEMAGSLAVAIASDQSTIPISGNVRYDGPAFTQAITPTSSADMSASPANLTPAPDTDQHTVVESISVSAAVPLVLTITEETTGMVLKVFNLTENNLNAEWNPTHGVRLPSTEKKLQGQTDGAGQIDVTVISHSAA